MKPLVPLLLAAMLLAPAVAPAQDYGPKRDATRYFFVETFGDYRADLDEARAAGKIGAVLMFHWNECPYCARMKANVLSREAVQRWYRERFLTLAVDTRGSLPVTDFAGRQTTEKAFATAAGVKVTPTLIFYDLSGKPIHVQRGEMRDPGEFMRLGEFVATGAYRTQSFDVYSKVPTSKGNP